MEMTIRQLHISETEAAAALLCRCMQETFRDLIPAQALAAFTLERARTRIGEAPETTHVIEENGALVGIGQSRGSEIAFLYLDRSIQGRGFGKALLVTLLADSRTAGETEAWLYVLVNNIAARRFYSRLGWREAEPVSITVNGVALSHFKCTLAL